MLPIYLYSNGATATSILNAIAAFINGGGYPLIISIASIFAIIGAMFQYMKAHDIAVLGRWFAVYFFITAILIGIKVPVQVIDLSNPMSAAGQVDNVPWGLAMPASIITSIEQGVTQSLSDVFHTVDDEDYNKTGMLFGARIFHTVLAGSTHLSAATRAGLSAFVSRCVIPDIIVNHKYTFDQITSSPNIFSFLSQQKMSPLRGIFFAGKFQTCAAVLPQLKDAVSNDSTEQFGMMARLLGYDPAKSNFNIQDHIQSSYQYLMGLSESAKDILMQNVAMNAVRNGISTSMAANNASSALINLSSTIAMHKQLLTDFASGHQATYMMPLIHTTLMLLLFGFFPIIVVMALIPSFTMHMVKTYLLSMIYLALWPVCFVVINFMISSALAGHLSALAIEHGGITLSNQDAALYEIEQFAGYASVLVNLTPVLAGGMLFGLYRVFMTASQVMLGSMQSQISQTASQMAQGDINLANTSVGNHNWNNWSANKHDTNATNFSGSTSYQLADGATKTITQDGHTVINASGAISNLPVGLNFASSLAASFQSSHDHAQQAAMSEQKSFNSAMSSAANIMNQYSSAHSNNSAYGSGVSAGSNTTFDHAMSNMNKLADEASHALGISKTEAAKGLTSLAVNGHASWNSGDEVFGKLAKWASGANIGGGLKAEALGQLTTDHSSTTSSNQSHSASRLDEFRSSLQAAKSYAENHHADIGHSQTASLANQFSSSLNKAQTASHNYSTDMSESARYSQMASTARQQSASLNENLSQQFVSYVKTHVTSPSRADAILSNANSPTLNAARQDLATSFLQAYENQATSWIEKNQPVGMGAVSSAGNEMISGQAPLVQSSFQTQNSIVANKGQGVQFDNNQVSQLQSQVQNAQHGAGSRLNTENQNISHSVGQSTNNTNASIASGQHQATKQPLDLNKSQGNRKQIVSFIENHSGVKQF